MSTVWLVAATSYYDDPVVHHIAETAAAAAEWALTHGGLSNLDGGYDHQPAVVLEWVVGSDEEIEPAVCRARRAGQFTPPVYLCIQGGTCSGCTSGCSRDEAEPIETIVGGIVAAGGLAALVTNPGAAAAALRSAAAAAGDLREQIERGPGMLVVPGGGTAADLTPPRLGRVLHALAGALAAGSLTPGEVADALRDISEDLIAEGEASDR